VRKEFLHPDGPRELSIPDDVLVTPASVHLPKEVIAFFGISGKWWGAWRSPQVKGGFEAVLIIERLGEAEAGVVYIVPDYPPWYIKGCAWRTTARIARRNGETERLSLIVPYDPLKTTMECWFEGDEFKGIMYGRFMKQVILWKPLP
jgi:hypothetical protein